MLVSVHLWLTMNLEMAGNWLSSKACQKRNKCSKLYKKHGLTLNGCKIYGAIFFSSFDSLWIVAWPISFEDMTCDLCMCVCVCKHRWKSRPENRAKTWEWLFANWWKSRRRWHLWQMRTTESTFFADSSWRCLLLLCSLTPIFYVVQINMFLGHFWINKAVHDNKTLKASISD